MFPRVRRVIRPPRKKDYFLPDGTVPRPRSRWTETVQAKEPYKLRYAYNRMTLEKLAYFAERGELVYVPRVYYKVELRQSIRIDGKPHPVAKTVKTWFIKESDLKGSALREFWKAISDDLAGFGLDRNQTNRIKSKIAEDIPKT